MARRRASRRRAGVIPTKARGQRRRCLLAQLVQDVGHALLTRHHADGLAGHDRALLHIAIDDGAPQGAGPEMLDVELGGFFRQLTGEVFGDGLRLVVHKSPGAAVDQAAYWDDREARVKLHGGQGVAGVGAEERRLEFGVGDAFGGCGEPCAELGAGRAHLQVTQDGVAPCQPAGDEDGHIPQMRQDFLGEHGERHRADMAAGFRAFDDDRVRTRTHQAFGEHKRGGEGDELGAAVFHRTYGGAGGNAAGEHDVADAGFDADFYQIIQVRMHGNQVNAKRFGGQRLGGGDFLGQPVRHHAAAGEHAETAGVGDGGDQVTFAHPAHRPAHDGGARTEEGAAARPELAEALLRGQDVSHRGHRRCAAPARRVRCIPVPPERSP